MLEVLTGLLVLITGVYAWVSFRILRANERLVGEMKLQSEAINRPYITVRAYTVPNSPILYLGIFNTGKLPAEKVKLEIDRVFYQFGDRREERNMATFSIFNQEIDCFAPGQEFKFMLGQGFVIFAEEADESVTPTVFDIKATYSFGDKSYSETNVIDLNPFRMTSLGTDPLISEIEGIRKAVEDLRRNWPQIVVDQITGSRDK